MSHQRIWTANTRSNFLTPSSDFESSQAVVAGDQVFLVGCTGLTLDGKEFVGEGDPAAQGVADQNHIVQPPLQDEATKVLGVHGRRVAVGNWQMVQQGCATVTKTDQIGG